MSFPGIKFGLAVKKVKVNPDSSFVKKLVGPTVSTRMTAILGGNHNIAYKAPTLTLPSWRDLQSPGHIRKLLVYIVE